MSKSLYRRMGIPARNHYALAQPAKCQCLWQYQCTLSFWTWGILSPQILPCELERGHAFNICLETEHSTRQRIARQRGLIQAFARRCDIELVQIFSAKDAGG